MVRISYHAASSLLVGIAATCQIPNKIGSTKFNSDASRSTLCQPQGSGAWTFAMTTELSSLGIPGGRDGPPNPSLTGGTSFMIYDNSCNLKGIYGPGTSQCGVPWEIEESFLPFVLSITVVSMDVGDPFFEFLYGDGKYSVRNNQCGCADGPGQFNDKIKDCKCAFPVNGKHDDIVFVGGVGSIIGG